MSEQIKNRLAAVVAAAVLTAGTAPAREVKVQHATGQFEVKITPQAQDSSGGVDLARMAVAKVFSGGLAGTGQGDMLTGAGLVPGSAAYVLIERINGTLDDRAGSFALMHSATLDRGKPDQHIVIVPDSGSGGLTGISGSLTMRIEAGVHYYDLAYQLPPR